MKILIVQLARLGDIYMSWPIARALKRKNSESQIHFLVREKFQMALNGLEANDKTVLFKTESILNDAVNNSDEPTFELERQLNEIKSENYDLIINLTFSPVSSYICYFLSDQKTKVLGYTRNTDSSFCLQDMISTFYYAQVGIEKFNRFHIIDIFASLCDVDLTSEDFSYPTHLTLNSPIKENYITIQLGASSKSKTLSPFIWSRVIKKFLDFNLGYKVVLLGSKEEESLSQEIFSFNSQSDIINLVGKTQLHEIFPILKSSTLHVGGDSVFVHICNLTQTPCLNLSFESVKFWETGPRSKGSFVLLNILPSNVESLEVAQAMKSVLTRKPLPQLIAYDAGVPCYSLKFNLVNDFEWALVKSLYIGDPFPVTDDLVFFKAMEKLNAVNDLVIDTLSKCLKEGSSKYVKFLDSQDAIIKGISRLSSKASIYIDWCLAEKIKVPPLTENKIVESYLRVHNELKLIMKPYLLVEEKTQEEEKNHG